MHRVYRALLGENPFLFLGFAWLLDVHRGGCWAWHQGSAYPAICCSAPGPLFCSCSLVLCGSAERCLSCFLLNDDQWLTKNIMQFFSTVCALVLLRGCCFGCLGAVHFFSNGKRREGWPFNTKHFLWFLTCYPIIRVQCRCDAWVLCSQEFLNLPQPLIIDPGRPGFR